MRCLHHKFGAILAVALTVASVLPASAEVGQKLLYPSNGPIVESIRFCNARISGHAELDLVASNRGLKTPTDGRGAAYATDKPRIKYQVTECEMAVFGVPKKFDRPVVPVTTQVFAKLNHTLTLEVPFGRILASGRGPYLHGGHYFKNDKYDGGVDCDIYRAGFGV